MSNRVPTRSASLRLVACLGLALLAALVAAGWHVLPAGAGTGAGMATDGSGGAAAFRAQTASFRRAALNAQARRASLRATAAGMKKYRYGSRTLKMGATGADVMKLQKYLTGLAFPTAPDGAFGQGTKRSVVGLERARGLKVDGVVPGKQARKIRLAAKKRRTNTTGHIFPVRGTHNFGGASAAFGAPRNGHTHQGQDVFAACATPLAAAQGGTVRVKAYQATGAGHYVVIRGASSGEDYVYMHMTAAFAGIAGQVVATGETIGSVGASGNATGCHLHFELWTAPGWYLGGAPYDPLPSLLAWDAAS